MGSEETATSTLSYLCESASIPGRAVNLTQFRSYHQPKKMVQSIWTDSDLTLTVICQRGLNEKYLFDAWQNAVANNQSTGDVFYYNDYVADKVTVVKVDASGFVEAEYDYIDVFPMQVSQISVSWGEVDTITKFSVSLAYRYWEQAGISLDSEVEKDTETTNEVSELEEDAKKEAPVRSSIGKLTDRLADINSVLGKI